MKASASPVRGVALSAMTLAGGAVQAVVPAATLIIGAQMYSMEAQGSLAVAVTVSTFVGQLAGGALVESRLSGGGSRRVRLPQWLVMLGVVAALVVSVFPASWSALAFALPVLVAGLEVGRSAGVAEQREQREVWASTVVGAGAVAAVGLAFGGSAWATAALVWGIALAGLIRSVGVDVTAAPLRFDTVAWISGDVAVTGFIFPLTNVVILGALGAPDAVLFTAVSTVSGLLAIPLNYLRARLLKEHSTGVILLVGAALAACILALGALQVAGVLGLLFGEAWLVADPLVPLAIACLWRIASLATTIPFAHLRREGHVGRLTLLRAACALATLTGIALVVPALDLGLIFSVLLGAELLQAAVYQWAWRRVQSRAAASDDLL